MNQSVPKILLKLPEACEALGVSRAKMYDLISQRRIKCVKLGSGRSAGVRFRLKDLQAFADENLVG